MQCVVCGRAHLRHVFCSCWLMCVHWCVCVLAHICTSLHANKPLLTLCAHLSALVWSDLWQSITEVRASADRPLGFWSTDFISMHICAHTQANNFHQHPLTYAEPHVEEGKDWRIQSWIYQTNACACTCPQTWTLHVLSTSSTLKSDFNEEDTIKCKKEVCQCSTYCPSPVKISSRRLQFNIS